MRGKYIKRKLNNAKKWVKQRPYYIRRTWNRLIIKNKDFTIISNNCWAGKTYQYLGMPYLSPTVGLYFFSDDYLKFISNLHYYFSLDIKFIASEKSKFFNVLKDKNQTAVPIGVLDDIEIIFLHYKSEKEALEKWERRKNRVNYKNIIIKFSNMNLCTEDHMKSFDSISFKNKFILNNRISPLYDSEIYWSGQSNEKEILNDTNPYPGNLKLIKLLNKKPEIYPESGFLC